MAGETGAALFFGAAGGAVQSAGKADCLEEGEAANLVRPVPLDRGIGDVMGFPTDWAMSMGHENLKIGQSRKFEAHADTRCRG